MASRNARSVCAVSDLALIILDAPESPFDQDGINPQRSSDSFLIGSFDAGELPEQAESERWALRAPSFLARNGVKVLLNDLLVSR